MKFRHLGEQTFWAKLISDFLNPPVTLLLAYAIQLEFGAGPVGVWQVVGYVALVGLIPVSVLFPLKRVGIISDINVYKKEERWIPLTILVCCSALATILALTMDWGEGLRQFAIGHLLSSVLLAAVTIPWFLPKRMACKASVHANGASALCVVAVHYLPDWVEPLAIMFPLVMLWARLHLRRHDHGEVLMGSLIGVVAYWVALQ